MRKYALMVAATMVAALAVTSTAGATQVEKKWVCHATGSESNPFVLINVPTNSAHLDSTKKGFHVNDKAPLVVEDENGRPIGLTCGEPGSPPTPPFTGDITFTLIAANCKPGEVGIPGFEVTVFVHEKFKDGELESFSAEDEHGRDVTEQVLFTFPATCIPVLQGPTGPQGPAGGTGPAGANGLPGATTTTTVLTATPRSCTSRRVYRFLVRKRFRGRLLTNVRASDPGANSVTVRRLGRRFLVTADYRGKKVGVFASQRHILVTASVGRLRLRFNENVDLCRNPNGAQNAPSASGLSHL
jgi:hypothetical protein